MWRWLLIWVSMGMVVCNPNINSLNAYVYYHHEENDNCTLIGKLIETENLSLEGRIQEIFEKLLDNEDDEMTLIPEGTILNKVIVIDYNLLLDFSKEFLGYGGTMWEEGLIDQVLLTAFQYEEINSVTIAIDGEIKNLVEGTLINGYTRKKWEERNTQ